MATAYASPVKHQFDQIMQDQDEADGSYLGSEQSQDAAEGHWRAITCVQRYPTVASIHAQADHHGRAAHSAAR